MTARVDGEIIIMTIEVPMKSLEEAREEITRIMQNTIVHNPGVPWMNAVYVSG